jgi:hypothetical protein
MLKRWKGCRVAACRQSLQAEVNSDFSGAGWKIVSDHSQCARPSEREGARPAKAAPALRKATLPN